MQGLLPITALFLLGMALQRMNKLPVDAPKTINTFIVHLSLPAVTLKYIHGLSFELTLLAPLVMPWAVFLLTAIIILIAGFIFDLPQKSIGCLIAVCGVGNTTIIGLPIIKAFLGPSGYGIALVADQANFLVMCTAVLVTINIYSGSAETVSSAFFRFATYPSVLAMIAAFILRPLALPVWFDGLLTILAATLTPLAVIAVGATFKFQDAKDVMGPFLLGLLVKLLAVPAIIGAVLMIFLEPGSETFHVTFLQSAMPPMILAGLIVMERGLAPRLASLLVSASIPLSFFTLFAWHVLMSSF